MAKEFYRIKIKPTRALHFAAKYGGGTIRKGKVTTARRKLTPAQVKLFKKYSRQSGYKIISVQKIKRRRR